MDIKHVCFFDSPYSKLFKDCSQELRKNNITSDFLISNYGYLAYVIGEDTKLLRPAIKNLQYSDIEIKEVLGIQSLNNNLLNKFNRRELDEACRFYAYFSNKIQTENSTSYVFYNDLRWQNAIAIDLLTRYNIPYIVLERGVYRPHTTSISKTRLNGGFKLPSSNEKATIPSKTKNYSKFLTYTRFATFLALSKIGKLFNLNTVNQNKSYSFLHYFKLLKKELIPSPSKKNQALPDKYLFIPLQVPTDTQCLIYSRFKNMHEAITYIESEFIKSELYNQKYKLIFKVHPMDTNTYNVNKSFSILIDLPIDSLIKHSKGVITINSTAGFESFDHFKNVITLGESFYSSFKGVTSDNNKNLHKWLTEKFTHAQYSKQEWINFKENIMFHYQIEGSIFSYNSRTINSICSSITSNKHIND